MERPASTSRNFAISDDLLRNPIGNNLLRMMVFTNIITIRYGYYDGETVGSDFFFYDFKQLKIVMKKKLSSGNRRKFQFP